MEQPEPLTPLTVSVVVCAHTMDRWGDIVDGVAALRSQTSPPVETILVVDGNSTLERRAAEAFPDVNVIANRHKSGVSGARNTGVAHAKGEVIAFLDDDARPDVRWIEELLKPYEDPSVVAVGGLALPVWPVDRPSHLVPELDWLVGCTYQGHPTGRSEVRNLFGCNMSVRRDAVELVGGFDENIGRLGHIPLGGDDTEFFIRLRQYSPGSKVVFEPRAVVHHRVTPERTTWAYLRSRSRAEGMSKAAIATMVGAADATSVESDYVTRVLTAGLRRELGRALRGNRAGWRGAGGIVACLSLTGWGYLSGRVRRGIGSVDEDADVRGAG